MKVTVLSSCLHTFIEVRPWADLAPAVSTMRNVYRERSSSDSQVPHSFLFKRREDLSAAEIQAVAAARMPFGAEPHSLDVFACIKHHMSDDHLAYDPVLVWPKNDHGKTRAFWESMQRHAGVRGCITPERAQALMELAEALRSYPNYSRAVTYLETLAGVRGRYWTGLPALGFLQHPGSLGVIGLRAAGLPRREAPAPPHRPLVRFHRP